MNPVILLLAAFASLVISTKLTRNERLCRACTGLNDIIQSGLKATKHKEGTFEQIGSIDSQGIKRGKKVAYDDSESRLTEILTDACKTSPFKLECYEIIEEDKYYEPIKRWFVGGRKNGFLQAICYSLIPSCSAQSLEKESSSSSTGFTMPGSTTATTKSRSLIHKLIGMLPQSLRREKPFIKNLPGRLSSVPVGKYSQLAKKYSSIAYTKGSFITRKFNKQLDRLPIRTFIATLPLPIKTATFVEKHWKLIIATLFLALLIPMYYLSCKSSGVNKGSERVRATRPMTRSSSRISKKNE